MTDSVVRAAKAADQKEIWRLFLQGHNENGLFELATDKVQWFINRVLFPEQIPEWDTGVRGIIGVIGPVGALEGLVFLVVDSYWYSHDKYLSEMLVYVDPEHRKTDHAKAIIAWMKKQVELTGLPLLTGIISNHRTEAKCRLYRRNLPKIGEFFLVPPIGMVVPHMGEQKVNGT